ncbi:MAG: DUF4255 domain-containing protein [Mycobacterium leprae]
MARYRAIAALADAVIRLLSDCHDPREFDQLEFKVFTARDFNPERGTTPPIKSGVSLFPYRLFVNGVNRNPGGGPRPALPIEVHFLLTIWGENAFVQNSLAGWVMRVLEDHPLLPASLLNTTQVSPFADGEQVQVVLGDLSTEDLFRIWERLAPQPYMLSIPYVARTICIESLSPELGGQRVVERQAGFAVDGGDQREGGN